MEAVHGIVRSHGGAIHVESAPGDGSTIEVLFPSTSALETLAAGASRAAGGCASDEIPRVC